MLSFKQRPQGAIVSIVACAVALLVVAAPAGADITTQYPPDSDARDFAASQGGWAGSQEFSSCPVVVVPCPTVANSFAASGGAGGEGYISSSFEATLATGTATAVWRSPGFTYGGADGEVPDSVSFEISRRANVGDLLNGIVGSSVTYAVALIDESEGDAVIPVAGPVSLVDSDAWAVVPAVSLDPGLLELGHDYAIRISSVYEPGTLLGVLVTGSTDYDDVVLAATRPDDPDPPVDPPTDPGDDGDDGKDGKDGNDGSDDSTSKSTSKDSSSSERETTVQGTTTGVVQNGRRVLVKLSCPARAKKSCRITAQGKLAGKSVTKRRTVKVAKGKSRVVSLAVKPRFREVVAERKRLQIVQKVKTGKSTRTFTRSRPLIQRG